MRLTRAIEEFIQHMRLQNRSRETLRAYEGDLQRLASRAAENSVLAFTPELVNDFLLWCSATRQNGPRTLKRKLSALREFSKWGRERGLWNGDPMHGAPKVRAPRTLPRPFSRDEVDRLLALPLSPLEDLIRALLLFTGQRVSPICGIRIGDVSDRPPVIRVLVKGSKTQIVAVHPLLREKLSSYILAHTDLRPQDPLLVNSVGRPVGRWLVERMAQRWGRLAGVPACTPHRFRHTFGTELLRLTHDLRLVQEAMAHESITSTAIYTEVAQDDVAQAVSRLRFEIPATRSLDVTQPDQTDPERSRESHDESGR